MDIDFKIGYLDPALFWTQAYFGPRPIVDPGPRDQDLGTWAQGPGHQWTWGPGPGDPDPGTHMGHGAHAHNSSDRRTHMGHGAHATLDHHTPRKVLPDTHLVGDISIPKCGQAFVESTILVCFLGYIARHSPEHSEHATAFISAIVRSC